MKAPFTILLSVLLHTVSATAATVVWIDTDPSVARGGHEVDDGFALIQAFHSRELLIRGVSVVFGNVRLNEALPIGQRIVQQFGPAGIRVYSGAGSARELGLETDASRALATALRQEELVVIAIGPLTNVATVLQKHPELSRRIKQIIAVAGRRPHQKFLPNESVVPFRDFNFEMDPAAFQVLLDAGVPLVLAPWEISSKVWIHSDDLASLRSADPSMAWMLDASRDWLNFWKQHLRSDGFNPFDTLAVGYAISADGFGCAQLPAEIQSLPDDTILPPSAKIQQKKYLILDKTLTSKSHALYCSQPPPQFKQEVIQRIKNSAPSSRAAFDYSIWNELTGKYVNSEHRVDYRTMKEHEISRLDASLQQFAAKWPVTLRPSEQKSALINAYNGFIVRWIIKNYPVESIWKTKHPFTGARDKLDGAIVSLDQIETRLRSLGDPRIHAALVCASRSCPPLLNEAYEPDRVDEQLDDNLRSWLANTHLNEFFPEKHMASVSMIFKWYGDDFKKAGGTVERTLARYAPQGQAQFLLEPRARLEFKVYNWGLNDVSNNGSSYSSMAFYWDALRNK